MSADLLAASVFHLLINQTKNGIGCALVWPAFKESLKETAGELRSLALIAWNAKSAHWKIIQSFKVNIRNAACSKSIVNRTV